MNYRAYYETYDGLFVSQAGTMGTVLGWVMQHCIDETPPRGLVILAEPSGALESWLSRVDACERCRKHKGGFVPCSEHASA